MKKLEKKIIISAKLKAITGLRIGDSKENLEIGGVDNPVIRRTDNNEPYIPGSSLKGKIRCLLEQFHGENAESNCQNTGSLICKLFGAAENGREMKKLNQSLKKKEISESEYSIKSETYRSLASRILVRDAYLTDNTVKKLKESSFTDMPFTEVKWENVIHRIKGNAEHPRQMERIPAGSEFDLNFIINIFQGDNEKDLLALFKKGLEVLQDDYLGGNGSRGYGQVEINEISFTEKSRKDYLGDLKIASA